MFELILCLLAKNPMILEAKSVLNSDGWNNPNNVLKEDGEFASSVGINNYIHVNFYSPPEDTTNKRIDSVFVRFKQKGIGELVNMPIISGGAVQPDTLALTNYWKDLKFDITKHINSWKDLYGLEDGFHHNTPAVGNYCYIDVVDVRVYYTLLGINEKKEKQRGRNVIYYSIDGRKIEKPSKTGLYFRIKGDKIEKFIYIR